MTVSTTKSNRTTIIGIIQILSGCALFFFFGMGALITKVWSFFVSGSGGMSLPLLLIGTIGGVFFLWRGIKNLNLASQFRKICRIIDKNDYIQLSTLEQRLSMNRSQLLSVLRSQLSKGFWPNAYLDIDNGAFMLNSTSPYLLLDSGNQETDELLKTANGFIHEMITCNLTISDSALKTQVERLSDIAKQIYGFIKKNPGKLRQVRQFTNYYLPTTVNLLKNYQDLQNQAIKGANIQESMQKIAGIMTTIETAFQKQLDDLYRDKTLDISVDIEVLQNMINNQDAIK